MLCLLPFFVYTQTIFINAAVQGGNQDGSSWENALPSLQAALNLSQAQSGHAELWIAQGTYYPENPNGRKATFQLPEGIALYGGFGGSESDIAQRAIASHPTILSGDIGVPGVPDDNVYNLLRGGAGDFVLDGLTIQDANGLDKEMGGNDESSFNGAALNIGGDVQQPDPDSFTSLLISNCIFQNNQARSGGAIFFAGDEIHIQNTRFEKNNAALRGGAVYTNRAIAPFSGITPQPTGHP